MAAIPTRFYALTVVRDGSRYALVQEHDTKHWYLPAGRVEPGETFFEAALRETKEEAGIDVELTGILRVEHTPMPDGTSRVRVFFVARPLSTALKTTADVHSAQARWCTPAEARLLTLRGNEVLEALRYVEENGAVHPLSLLALEGAAFP